jgi:hypothetical protein
VEKASGAIPRLFATGLGTNALQKYPKVSEIAKKAKLFGSGVAEIP